jgi:hypothetical protein
MPKNVYIKSAFRHFVDWWLEHRGMESREGLEDALCALMFNTMGYLHEHLHDGVALPDMNWENFFQVHSKPAHQTCTGCSHDKCS